MTNNMNRTSIKPDVRTDVNPVVDNRDDGNDSGSGGLSGLTSESWSNIPADLRSRDQWLMWDSSNDTPRRPHWNGDFSVSYSDPTEWHSFEKAVEFASTVDSWGIGYVCALDNPEFDDGEYGVIDIDGGVTDDDCVKDWVPNLAPFNRNDAYLERSPSETGIHIPIKNLEVPGWWTDVQIDRAEHEGVDVLTNSFCTFTGDTESDCGVAEDNGWVNFWLSDVHESIGDDSSRGDMAEVSHGSGFEPDEEWLTESDIRDALNYIDADVGYNTWRDIGFAVTDFFRAEDGDNSGELRKKAEKVFVEWSRTGDSKWDCDAEQQGRRIIRDAFDEPVGDKKITIGTLIHLAQQDGWVMPAKPDDDNPTNQYLAVADKYAPGDTDPFMNEVALLVACVKARDHGAVPDDADVPEKALHPVVEFVTGVDADSESVTDDAWGLARDVFDSLDEETALNKFAAELPG